MEVMDGGSLKGGGAMGKFFAFLGGDWAAISTQLKFRFAPLNEV